MSYGTPHRNFVECESTNDHAALWAADPVDPAPDGAMVTADRQTKGRGRRGRNWESGAAEDVLMSVVVRGNGGLESAWQVGYVCSLAVADVLQELSVPARIKWPNDVLVNRRKICGVLVELLAGAPGTWTAIAGIGVNVNRESFGDAAAYHYPPTSLFMETGVKRAPAELARRIASALESRELTRRREGWKPLLDAIRGNLARGADVTWGGITGYLEDIGENGQAIVRTPQGTLDQWRTVDQDEIGNSV